MSIQRKLDATSLRNYKPEKRKKRKQKRSESCSNYFGPIAAISVNSVQIVECRCIDLLTSGNDFMQDQSRRGAEIK